MESKKILEQQEEERKNKKEEKKAKLKQKIAEEKVNPSKLSPK